MKKAFVVALILISCIQTFSQSVYIDSIRINDLLSRTIKFKDFEKSGIKVDSIISAKPRDKYDPDSLIYVGSSLFWYYSKQNICEAHVIRFDKIYSLRLEKYLVNKSTSFEDLKEMFPIDCDHTDPISIYRTEGIFQTCSIPVKDQKGQIWSMRIMFFLKNNKIVRVDFWEPM